MAERRRLHRARSTAAGARPTTARSTRTSAASVDVHDVLLDRRRRAGRARPPVRRSTGAPPAPPGRRSRSRPTAGRASARRQRHRRRRRHLHARHRPARRRPATAPSPAARRARPCSCSCSTARLRRAPAAGGRGVKVSARVAPASHGAPRRPAAPPAPALRLVAGGPREARSPLDGALLAAPGAPLSRAGGPHPARRRHGAGRQPHAARRAALITADRQCAHSAVAPGRRP